MKLNECKKIVILLSSCLGSNSPSQNDIFIKIITSHACIKNNKELHGMPRDYKKNLEINFKKCHFLKNV